MVAYFYNSNVLKHDGELQAVLNIKNNTALPRGNDRFLGWHGDFRHGVAIEDIERGQLGEIGKLPWQTDDSIGPWFWMENRKYKTPKYIINQLIDIVSKNGNLLLNVPPREDGTLDDQAIALLEEIGKWMKVNGEGIYNTRPFIQYGENPVSFAGGHFTSMNEMTDKDIRFTTRGDVIYAFTGDMPQDEVIIKSLNSVSYRSFHTVEMLGIDEPLEFIQDSEALKILMPDTFPCDYSVCLKLIPGDY